jgi:hypothetical protein
MASLARGRYKAVAAAFAASPSPDDPTDEPFAWQLIDVAIGASGLAIIGVDGWQKCGQWLMTARTRRLSARPQCDVLAVHPLTHPAAAPGRSPVTARTVQAA